MSISKTINDFIKRERRSKSWVREKLIEELEKASESDDDDIDTGGLNPNGNVYFFNYKAEYPENYPYYDRFPMAYIINVNTKNGTILGANLHYLFPQVRDEVARNLINKGGEWRGIVPTICLHTYLIKNCGTFYRVPKKEWEGLSKLPVQDFRNPSGRYVSDNKVWSGNK